MLTLAQILRAESRKKTYQQRNPGPAPCPGGNVRGATDDPNEAVPYRPAPKTKQ